MKPNSICCRAISVISYPKPVWRYLLLFQSWAQFSSWIVIASLTTLLMHNVLGTLDDRAIPFMGLFIGTMLGSLVSVFLALPAQCCVRPESGKVMRALTESLEKMQYVEVRHDDGMTIYRQNLPRILRWDESNIIIHRSGDLITISGAWFIVARLRKALRMGEELLESRPF